MIRHKRWFAPARAVDIPFPCVVKCAKPRALLEEKCSPS